MADEQQGIDAVLLMDSSGSMKHTDPQDLRKPAAKLFISLLRDDDRVGVVTFSESALILMPLTGTKQPAKENKDLMVAVDAVDSRGPYTNLQEAIKTGFEILSNSQKNEKLLILMSDGKMDVGDALKDEALISALTTSTLPALAKAGIKIHTIAFTEGSDQALLRNIAHKTGGTYRLAKTGKDLHLVFASFFELIKSPDTLPVQDNGFTVDKEVREMTVLITKKTPQAAVIVTSPAGRSYRLRKHPDEVRWFDSPLFSMVTVRRPQPGGWTIQFSSGASDKVYVITDLKLISSIARNVVAPGETITIEARLEKDGRAITTKELLEQVKLLAKVTTSDNRNLELTLVDDGTNGDIVTGDGIYTVRFLADQPADYSVRIVAEAETFVREKTVFVQAVQPVVAVQRVGPPSSTATATIERVVHVREGEAVNWGVVVIKFMTINIVVALLIVAGYFMKQAISRKKRKAPDAH